MSMIPLILTAILTGALVVIIAPGIFAMNRGKVLRNIAIWLAIFAALGLFYQYFGPGSTHPLFNQPDAFRSMKPMPAPGQQGQNPPAITHDYTPPRE